jgi:hypothetical protein
MPARRSTAPVSGEPNPKQPCPCGSGRRYKACHGRGDVPVTKRPFEGLASECDWVGLHELVPSATAPLALADPAHAGREVVLASVLPMAVPALVSAGGGVMVALQTPLPTSDPALDLAHALRRALDAAPGTMVGLESAPPGTPPLATMLSDAPLAVTVHDSFGFWVDDPAAVTADITASLERANETVFPTARLRGVDAAYWCRPGDKAHLRWVMPHPEEALLDALARLSAAGELGLGEGTRFAGSFRALGLLVPVWDLPVDDAAAAESGSGDSGSGNAADRFAERWEGPAAAFAKRLDDALAESTPLTDAERRARAGLRGRQVTLR